MARRVRLYLAAGCLVLAALLAYCRSVEAQGVPFGIGPAHQASKQGGAVDPFAAAVLNYDASTFLTNGSTKDGSDNVTLLKNLGTGGSTYDLTVVGGTPLWTDDGMGTGLDGIDFEANDTDWLAVNATPVTAAPMHVFMVAKLESGGPARTAAYVGASGSSAGLNCFQMGVNTTPATVWQCGDGSSASAATHGTSVSTGTVYLFEGWSTDATVRGANLDDGTEATNSFTRTPSGVDRFAVGCRVGSNQNQPWDGMIGQVLVYDSVQTGATRDAIIAALDAKWNIPGVTGLPPLGPSDPYVPPLLLAAAGLAVLALSLWRLPQQREGRLLRLQPEAARRAA